jgi:hypothetical protein
VSDLLEPDELKGSSPVLRGERGRKAPDLPGRTGHCGVARRVLNDSSCSSSNTANRCRLAGPMQHNYRLQRSARNELVWFL